MMGRYESKLKPGDIMPVFDNIGKSLGTCRLVSFKQGPPAHNNSIEQWEVVMLDDDTKTTHWVHPILKEAD